jgi:long-chain acyl-CoA synthetase
LQAIKPHFFTTVPRLLEKVYEKIYSKGEELTGIKRKLFFWALDKTDKYDYQHPLTGFGASIADKLIFSKWREALGGRIKGIITGAAPCPHNILRVFSAAGIPCREAYGLTETSPGLTISGLDDDNGLLGTVGPAVFNVDLHIDTSGPYREGEGEILAHGPNVMMGYYKLPEATAEVFTELDGKRWFRTGDIGMLVKGPGGREFLKITDRKKELLKTSGGKYVAPAPIEGKFKEEFLIEHFMVVGDNRKFVSALIVPSEEALQKWYSDNGKSFSSLENAINDDSVIDMYAKIVERLNPRFSHIEQIKKFKLIAGPWDVTHADGTVGELTPTMKLKRRVVLERYSDLIDRLYA